MRNFFFIICIVCFFFWTASFITAVVIKILIIMDSAYSFYVCIWQTVAPHPDHHQLAVVGHLYPRPSPWARAALRVADWQSPNLYRYQLRCRNGSFFWTLLEISLWRRDVKIGIRLHNQNIIFNYLTTAIKITTQFWWIS